MYRIDECIDICASGSHFRLITPELVLAVCSRESLMQNIIGGIPNDSDTGAFQLNRKVWHAELREMPGCKSGSWRVSPGHKASELGYCPTFLDGCTHARDLLTANYLIAAHAGVKDVDTRMHIAVAGYNRGGTGALMDFKRYGDADYGTAHQNYGKDVLGVRLPQVTVWFEQHGLVD